MNCNSCSRQTLSLFIRAFANTEILYVPRSAPFRNVQASRFSSDARPVEKLWKQRKATSSTSPPSRFPSREPSIPKDAESFDNPPKWQAPPVEPKQKEPWQIQKEALKAKLNGEAWNPRKKLSPDTMEGIRHLHKTYPERFTTPVLADHFKVSPEAIRRILKSRWTPSDEQTEDRLKRWDKRGERIWANMVEMGVKPPKKWREMGVGRAEPGQKPLWKTRSRNSIPVNDSARDDVDFEEDLIPIVDGRTGERLPQRQNTSWSDRM